MNCNPSARLEEKFEDNETEAAAEGTAAHALCEHKLRKMLKLRSRKPTSKYDCDEMDEYTDGYVEFVSEQIAQAKQFCKDPLVLIEQKLDFSCYVPDGFGTGDCLVVADHAGYHDIYKKSLIPITEMEKLMGKKTFAEVLGGLVVKPQGKPTLVPASDKRPAIIVTGAEQDFTEITED